MQSGALAAFPILGIGCFCFLFFVCFVWSLWVCVIFFNGVWFWLAYRVCSWFANSRIFNGIVWDLCVVFWECEGLLWCLLLVGPKQQDGIAMTSELVFLILFVWFILVDFFQWALLPFCVLMDWLVLGLLRCVGNLLSLGFAVEISGFHGKSLVFSRTLQVFTGKFQEFMVKPRGSLWRYRDIACGFCCSVCSGCSGGGHLMPV
jgi:hypothetical protein